MRDASGRSKTVTANVFISGVGQLNRPSIPSIPGLRSFEGAVFHTAEWDHDLDLRGRRVALVGTGASSMQVGPSIAADVGRLLVFQRELPFDTSLGRPHCGTRLSHADIHSALVRNLESWADDRPALLTRHRTARTVTTPTEVAS